MAAKGYGALEPSLLADAAAGELGNVCVGNPLLRLLIACPADCSSPSRTSGRCRAARQRRPAARPSSSCHMPWALRSPRRRQIPGARSVLHQRPGGCRAASWLSDAGNAANLMRKKRSLGCSSAVASARIASQCDLSCSGLPCQHLLHYIQQTIGQGAMVCAGQSTPHPGGKQLKWSQIEDQACLK